MRNFYHTCKFFTLTITFSEVWPRQILDLGKYDDTSWKRLEDVWLKRIYSSWSRRLEDVFWRWRRKSSWRRLHHEECLLGPFIQSSKSISLKFTEKLCVMTKKNYAKRNWHKEFEVFWPEHWRISKNCTLLASFWPKYIMLS